MSVCRGICQATKGNPSHLHKETKETDPFLLPVAVWQQVPAPGTRRTMFCQSVTVLGAVTQSPAGVPPELKLKQQQQQLLALVSRG